MTREENTPVDPDRWQRVNELFHAALGLEPAERAAFLETSCGADSELREEVASLLASHARADDFIETPAYEAGAELLHGPSGGQPSPSGGQSLVGKRLGQYEISSSLGYGGMGVVYLAEDTRLGRPVAIKALAHHLGRDERSRERLRREARAAAALSHQGIATVFALEEFDDQLYIVYEYAEGETLRDELERGPLPFDLAVTTALAIARALEAAHRLGIVHRDLKPENVIRTRDGGIKILDFGLASFQGSPLRAAGDSAGDEPAGSGPEPIDARLTLPGVILGTPSYMAPEQLRGRDVDFRADQFSFGVLLYEMVSGIHPFEGDDPASTMARILEVEPFELASVAEAADPGTLAILETCLRKDPADRYPSTSALVEALEGMAGGTSAETSVASAGSAERAVAAAASQDAAAVSASEDAAAPPVGLAETVSSGERPRRHDAIWWWRFHQLAAGFGYYALLLALWWVRETSAGTPQSGSSTAMLLLAVLPVVVAGSLRIHLAFTYRYYPDQLQRQRRRARPWIRWAEYAYVLVIGVGAALSVSRDADMATFLIAAAVGVFVFSTMIEPATTRAAFPDDERRGRT